MSLFQKRLQTWISSVSNYFNRGRSTSESTANLVDAAPGPSQASLSSDYTEFGVPCPSCGGTGMIPKELEETLVALIPMSDDRLKPKKTVLYVSMGIASCIVIAAALMFFFLPRTVLLSTNNLPIEIVNVFDRDNVTHSRIQFYFPNAVNVTNNNYFPVDVINVSATIISKFQPWSRDIVGNGFNQTSLRISPFGGNSQQIWFNNTVSLKDVVAHQEQVTISTHQQACCLPSGNCTSPY